MRESGGPEGEYVGLLEHKLCDYDLAPALGEKCFKKEHRSIGGGGCVCPGKSVVGCSLTVQAAQGGDAQCPAITHTTPQGNVGAAPQRLRAEHAGCGGVKSDEGG